MGLWITEVVHQSSREHLRSVNLFRRRADTLSRNEVLDETDGNLVYPVDSRRDFSALVVPTTVDC